MPDAYQTDVWECLPDAHATDSDGRRPLHRAAEFGHGRVVEQLFEHNPDRMAPDLFGDIAYNFAERNGFSNVVDTFTREHVAKAQLRYRIQVMSLINPKP